VGGAQSASFTGTATDIVYESVTLQSADIKGSARDIFRAPQIDGNFAVRNMSAGGLSILSANGLRRVSAIRPRSASTPGSPTAA